MSDEYVRKQAYLYKEQGIWIDKQPKTFNIADTIRQLFEAYIEIKDSTLFENRPHEEATQFIMLTASMVAEIFNRYPGFFDHIGDENAIMFMRKIIIEYMENYKKDI